MRVSRSHPLLGWLRLDGNTYSRTLDQSLRERDWALESNPTHSGHADGFIDWVWTVQLPELCRNSNYRKQVEARCDELQAKSDRLSREINAMVGSLLSEQSAVDTEREQLQVLLEE